MSKLNKILGRVVRGDADASIRFDELCNLLKHLGFSERIRGSHHIFTREGIEEILNLQPRGNLAKAYQVKQVRGVLISGEFVPEDEEESDGQEDIPKKG